MTRETRRLDGSFVALRRLARSFDELEPGGRPPSLSRERSLRRIARDLGATAVPVCARELAAADEARAEWAYALLVEIARTERDRPRVAHALAELAESPDAGDRAVLRAVGLLDALGEPVPAGARLRDPGAAHHRALDTLAAALTAPEEAARIADGLVTGASRDRIAELAGALVHTDRVAAASLLSELLARHEIEGPFRLELSQLASLLPAQRAPGARQTRTYRGQKAGRRVIVAHSVTDPAGVRALFALIDESGYLVRAHYRDELGERALQRELFAPLENEGFSLAPASAPRAARALAEAARRALATRGTLPRDYYLGRHLLGLRGDHGPGERQGSPRERARVLSRARELLSRAAPERARLLLEGFLRQSPADADARASLGLCLLAQGEPGNARPHFERAAELDPDNPTHVWNLAAAAHREGRPGACYLALCRFLSRGALGGALADQSDETRRASARAYVAEYERLARLEHPHTDVPVVARAEAIYCSAKLTLARGDAETTISALREVVAHVPTHYAAWAHLGMALSARGQIDAARESLEQALAIRPDDVAARETLRSLRASRTGDDRRG